MEPVLTIQQGIKLWAEKTAPLYDGSAVKPAAGLQGDQDLPSALKVTPVARGLQIAVTGAGSISLFSPVDGCSAKRQYTSPAPSPLYLPREAPVFWYGSRTLKEWQQ